MRLRVHPAGGRNAIEGTTLIAEDQPALRVRVTAPPEGGKANAAVIKLLARAWGLPKSALEIAAGASDRSKLLALRGDPAVLKPRLEAWLGAHLSEAGR